MSEFCPKGYKRRLETCGFGRCLVPALNVVATVLAQPAGVNVAHVLNPDGSIVPQPAAAEARARVPKSGCVALTAEMVEAGRKVLEQQDPIRVSHARVIWLWNDMHAAAIDRGGQGGDK